MLFCFYLFGVFVTYVVVFIDVHTDKDLMRVVNSALKLPGGLRMLILAELSIFCLSLGSWVVLLIDGVSRRTVNSK